MRVLILVFTVPFVALWWDYIIEIASKLRLVEKALIGLLLFVLFVGLRVTWELEQMIRGRLIVQELDD